MLLTCPKCRSGLEVPDGTAAMVRCPACKTVFSPEDGASPEPDEDEEETEEEEDQPKAKRKPQRGHEDDEDEGEDDKPRKKGGKKSKEENRDFDPADEEEDRKRRWKNRRRDADGELSPEERAARKAAFDRAAIGVKLVWISFAAFLLSMLIILVFFFQAVFVGAIPYFITIAGVLGLVNWLLAAVGVGLCLSGPRAPGHWGYGISAAVAVGVHLVFLLVLVVQAREVAVGVTGNNEVADYARWGQLPTRIDATMLYLTAIFYRNEFVGFPKGSMTLSMICGVVEMVRTVLIMMLLSCLSRAALDEDLAHKCTRAAGIASLGPGFLALGMLVFAAVIIETNATGNFLGAVLFLAVMMGTYAFLMGVIFPAFMTAREVADACDEPFQSLIPQL